MFDQDLRNRIDNLSFDPSLGAGETQVRCANRPAREDGRPSALSGQARKEHRRFLDMAPAAGDEIAPFDAAGKAWRGHPAQRRQNRGLCTDALGAARPHSPAVSGSADRTRHADNHPQTLARWEAAFDAAPPRDICSDAAIRFKGASRMRPVNPRARRRPAPRSSPARVLWAMPALGLTGPAAAASAVAEQGGGSGDGFGAEAVFITLAGAAALFVFLRVAAFLNGLRRDDADRNAGDGYGAGADRRSEKDGTDGDGGSARGG